VGRGAFSGEIQMPMQPGQHEGFQASVNQLRPVQPPPLPGNQPQPPAPPARQFTPIIYAEPAPSKFPLGVWLPAAICGLLIVGGLIFTAVRPQAKAETPPDYQTMSNRELAEDGSPDAAQVLAQRIVEGEPADRLDAEQAARKYGNERLGRNLPLAMAFLQRKHAQAMVRRANEEAWQQSREAEGRRDWTVRQAREAEGRSDRRAWDDE
jgi:hypothetical protein